MIWIEPWPSIIVCEADPELQVPVVTDESESSTI